MNMYMQNIYMLKKTLDVEHPKLNQTQTQLWCSFNLQERCLNKGKKKKKKKGQKKVLDVSTIASSKGKWHLVFPGRSGRVSWKSFFDWALKYSS